MRIANVGGRLTLISAEGAALDVAKASDGRFPSDPQAAFEQWDELRRWGEGKDRLADTAVDLADMCAPVPRPRQVFAMALNYAEHVSESRMQRPSSPSVFTKFPTSITGPHEPISLPCATVDWEVELVVVIGRAASGVSERDAWSHVAGLTVGQDLSERTLQLAGSPPQFCLGKSYPGFAPLGPSLVTVDEVANPDDLALGCELDGEVMQQGRTSDMLFNVPEQISRLSAVCCLLPGDIIFTGTPSGIGAVRTPPRFIEPGEVLSSWVEGVGQMRNPFVSGPTYGLGPTTAGV